ncbi:MAG: hypothetical protein CUN54_07440 [Phototrophicales bacterium]|nr:MAG: hypothetical protein CUN54_07440 [Phototrophicales bacterium]
MMSFAQLATKTVRVFLFASIVWVLSMTATFAQDTTSRVLTPGTAVSGILDANNVAQVYTFRGATGQTVDLTANTDVVGLPLALLLTNSQGQALSQIRDTTGAGTISLSDVVLPQDDNYFVTVLPAAGAGAFAQGEFSLVLDTDIVATPAPAVGVVVSTPETVAAPTAATELTDGFVPPSNVLTSAGLQFALNWNTTADLNLEVRDPVGGSVFWNLPLTASGGSFISPNVNGGCEATTTGAAEQIQWPAGAVPTGSYEILVYYEDQCDSPETVDITVNATIDGNALAPLTATLQPGQVYIGSVIIGPDGTVTTGPSGINSDVLPGPVNELLAAATPIERNTPVSGVITNNQPFQTFAFTANANDIVTINMNATLGNLDTQLILLDPNGNIIDSNDDLADDITNSSIPNRPLVTAGTYTIVATRYGQTVGGTQGNFELTLTGATVELSQDLIALNLPDGAIEISLLWDTNADLQLLVRDPSGEVVFDDNPASLSGAQLAANGNANCVPSATRPVSYIFWPQGRLPAGAFEVEVWYQDTCQDTRPVTFTLNVLVNENPVIATSVQPFPGQRYVTNFMIDVTGQVRAGEGGFIGTNDVLTSSIVEYQTQIPLARPITSGETVASSITQDKKFDLYSFEGQAGSTVNISMQTTAGNLDPTLFLIAPSGLEIAQNDDVIIGEDANALIGNLTLPENGQYIIIATHFGGRFGATTGTYNLTFASLG